MGLKVWINGEYHEKDQAKVSVYDHGLLYGDGVFEGIRSYGGRVFRLEQHLDRLYDSAKGIMLEIPMTRAAMADQVVETLKVNDLPDGYIRLIVTRGKGSLGVDPRSCHDPQVIIIADSISLYPPELYEVGLKVATVATIRNHPMALSARIKSLNYLNNVLAKIESIAAGYDEAIMLNHKGEVAECAGDNIFVMRRGELRTPSTEAGLLEGVTRGAVMELARARGMSVREMALTRHDLYVAEECFLTGTAAEIISVVAIDQRPVGDGKPGPITASLLADFRKLTRQG